MQNTSQNMQDDIASQDALALMQDNCPNMQDVIASQFMQHTIQSMWET